MIGNDVIDLNDPESLPHKQHRRFDRMAFTADERAQLRKRGNRQADRWSMWASKEAAYKLLKQSDESVRFIPRRFNVELSGSDECLVVHENIKVWIRLKTGADYIHALALKTEPLEQDELPPVVIVRLETPPARPPSTRIRKLVCRMAAQWFGCRETELNVVTENKIPRLVDAKGAHRGYLSLSHHGRYMAFTLLNHEQEQGAQPS